MTTIGERIALIIQKNNLKKVQFAEKLGISGAYVTHLVKGKNAPSDALVKLICREFRIREEWLLTGTLPMEDSEPMTPLTEYAQERGMTAFEERMVHAWFDLPLDIRQMLMEHFRERLTDGGDLLDNLTAHADNSPLSANLIPIPEQAGETDEERMEREAREEAEEYYRFRLEEKRQIEAEAKLLDGTGRNSSSSESNIA